MSKLFVYTVEDTERWDAVVRSFEKYDVCYLNCYVKALQIHGDGDPLLFYYEADDLRGVNVVMKRDIAKDSRFTGAFPAGTWFDFATPYGYGGWILEGDGDPAPLNAAYCEWCRENKIVSDFTRFDLYSNSRDCHCGDVIYRTDYVVREIDRPMDEMLMDFEHKVRKNVKKAQSFGLQLLVDTDGSYLSDFLRIYYSTMDRNDALENYYFKEEYFRQINEMRGNFAYFHVLLEDKIISTELVTMANGTMYSYLGGTDGEYFAYRPNDFLKYNIICWGAENGYRRFIMGGGYHAGDGIFRYKKSLAPNGLVPFYTGQTIFDPAAYEMLVGLRGELPESGFFPRYRA